MIKILNAVQYVVNFLSAEFLLRQRANNGSIVFLRSVLVTIILYALAIGLRSYTEACATFKFSLDQLVLQVSSTIPWLGAIFAGVYAALYSRFVSQWNYLASFYNQLMHTLVTHTREGRDEEQLIQWKASFVEDAYELHLACKPIFAPMVKSLLEDSDVRAAFRDSTSGGSKKLEVLDALIKGSFGS